MASNNPMSPRQKMINLMYLVFIAMLALNVSNEVLDGFDLVEEGLEQTIKSTETQNNTIIQDLSDINAQNPAKAGQWYGQAKTFNNKSDSLFNYIQNLKTTIVKEADGKNGNLKDIKNKENLDAATTIMLDSKDKEGVKLKEAIDGYRDLAIDLVQSDTKKENIKDRLNTDTPAQGKRNNKNWQETLFEKMPTSAAITLLTKIQSDIRAAQGEVLSDLYNNIDAKDYRVNSLQAQVVPKSEFVMAGGTYQGKVVLTAVDTTKKPRFSIPGIKENGEFSIGAGAVGINKTFTGNLILNTPDGDRIYPFKSQYHVVPKMSTIQIADANVLYAGEPNKLTISVPGASNDQLRATATNGTISKSGENWIATPSKAGVDMKISVSNGTTFISDQIFKVRLLPDPTPYIEYKDADGNLKRYKGGRIAKATILNASGIKAAIDDGLIDRQFPVIRFTTVFFDAMGNAVREVSEGTNFSDRQKSQIKQLSRGKSFFISDVKVRGRDGVERDLTALEVRIN